MARLSVDGALEALALVETIAATFVATAPIAAAKMGGADGIVARCEITGIGPMPRLTIEEWSAMAVERTSMQEDAIARRWSFPLA